MENLKKKSTFNFYHKEVGQIIHKAELNFTKINIMTFVNNFKEIYSTANKVL